MAWSSWEQDGPGWAVFAKIFRCYARFVRGDANRDGRMNMADAAYTVGYLFEGYECLNADTMDVDDNGAIDLSDAVYLLQYLFKGRPEPAGPFPGAGIDLTPDALGCARG